MGRELSAEEFAQQVAADFLDHVLLEGLAEAGEAAALLTGAFAPVFLAEMAHQTGQLADEVSGMALAILEDGGNLLEARSPFPGLCVAILRGVLHLADQPVNQLEGLLRRVAELRVALLDLFDIHKVLTFLWKWSLIGQ